AESVTEAHPHKIPHQVSHPILHQILNHHPNPRVPSQTTLTTPIPLISPQISTTTYLHIPKLVTQTIEHIPYTTPKYPYHSQAIPLLTPIDRQSPHV
ncbi:S-adenosylmethionine synthetase N-terminal domain-containing protein, partial [Staphylococcus epidermidis]|uniref:S-adenosylmethionine synthetase N-terminal domain-containing protein n=1 Tax=Staphylococcus epidermidis TaxID=1282 RepID=UPI0028CB789B